MTTDVVKQIRRATRRRFTAEEKIHIVLEGLRGEIPVCFSSAKVGHIRAESEERVGRFEGVRSHPLKGLILTAHQSMPMLVMAQPKGERYDHRCRQTDP